MTAVSLISPYAPQPANTASPDQGTTAMQGITPLKPSDAPADTGLASDQSGEGAGNGTGTGGAQLAELLKRGRQEMQVQRASPESIVGAQSTSGPATEFLERQALQQAESNAADKARLAERAQDRAAAAKAEAEEAAKSDFVLPNPLPTAPILRRNGS